MIALFLFLAVETLVMEVPHAVLTEQREPLVGTVAVELSSLLDLRR